MDRYRPFDVGGTPSVGKKSLLVVAGLILVGFVACDTPSPTSEVKVSATPDIEVVDTTVAFPNVIGMTGLDAKRTVEDLFPNGTAYIPAGGEAYEYSVANRCIWKDPAGEMTSNDGWPVSSVVLVLDPSLPSGTSATEPVQPGPARSFDKIDRLFFSMQTEKPSDVRCEPYGEVGPAGGAPNIDVPNHDDGGESPFCRRHRWC